jgi:hypothetical protein
MQFVGTFEAHLILTKCKDNMTRMGAITTHEHGGTIYKISF